MRIPSRNLSFGPCWGAGSWSLRTWRRRQRRRLLGSPRAGWWRWGSILRRLSGSAVTFDGELRLSLSLLCHSIINYKWKSIRVWLWSCVSSFASGGRSRLFRVREDARFSATPRSSCAGPRVRLRRAPEGRLFWCPCSLATRWPSLLYLGSLQNIFPSHQWLWRWR